MLTLTMIAVSRSFPESQAVPKSDNTESNDAEDLYLWL